MKVGINFEISARQSLSLSYLNIYFILTFGTAGKTMCQTRWFRVQTERGWV